MQDPAAVEVVATKVQPPTLPASTHRRTRLEAVLEHGAGDPQRRLVIVSAPAGSGKTTLVASWVASTDAPCTWLQLDHADDDPARFWRHLAASIGVVHPDVEAAVSPLLAASAADADPTIDRLVNGLATTPGPTVIVLDDYHLVDDESIHRGLQRFVELVPDDVTVVLVTRHDPPLALARLRVRGQLVELRADDLRFARADVDGLLGPSATALPVDDVTRLHERTEGWAAGLVLAGLSLAASDDAGTFVRTFDGSDEFVIDYLTDEFLSGLQPDDRRRYLATSVLAELNGPVVEEMLDVDDGTTWLRTISSSNQLVIGLDRSGTRFRYHHLLADVLQEHAAVELAAELPALHLRAGRWLADHGDPHRAVEHLIAASAPTEAADVIWTNATELLNRGEIRTVAAQLARLGPTGEHHVGALIVAAWIAVLTGRFDDADRIRRQALAMEPTEAEERGMLAALGTMSNLARGDVAAALAIASSAPAPTDSTQVMTRAFAFLLAGRWDECRQLVREARARAEREEHTVVLVATRGYEAVLDIEQGDRARALTVSEAAVAEAAQAGLGDASQATLAYAVRCRASADDVALEAAGRAIDLAQRGGGRLTSAYALASAAEALRTGDAQRSRTLVGSARSIIAECPDPGIVGVHVQRVAGLLGEVDVRSGEQPLEALTERELEVLHLLPTARSQREIAADLYVSLNTVKTHCRAIFRKLGVSDRRSAVQAARDRDLL